MPAEIEMPPRPDTPPPEKVLAEVMERARRYDAEDQEQRWRYDRTDQVRELPGRHGWSASLWIGMDRKIDRAAATVARSALSWWEETAREAVRDCPAPENASAPGRAAQATANRSYTEAVLFLPQGDGEYHNIHIEMTLEFNGRAPASDVIWPFDLERTARETLSIITDALGGVVTGDHQGRGIPALVHLHTIRPRRQKTPRVFQDFSGRTPEERNLYEKPAPPPLRPGRIWTTGTHRLSGRICGGEQCRYKARENQWDDSPCDEAWRKHSAALFQAFREANPELQYRDRRVCPLEAQEKRHTCSRTTCHYQAGGHPLDHDEICRFPDGAKLIISHPYPHGENDSFSEKLARWRIHVPDMEVRSGGAARSWYFPGRSHLVIIGQEKTLARVSLEYEMPARTGPTGCVRWEDGQAWKG